MLRNQLGNMELQNMQTIMGTAPLRTCIHRSAFLHAVPFASLLSPRAIDETLANWWCQAEQPIRNAVGYLGATTAVHVALLLFAVVGVLAWSDRPHGYRGNSSLQRCF
jgi:hypothetical protein